MSRISWLHPICVAVMPPKEIHASRYCTLGLNIIITIPFSRLRDEAHLTHMALRQVIGSFSQATSEDRRIGDETVHVLIQFRGAY
jgi:hypothetical protein